MMSERCCRREGATCDRSKPLHSSPPSCSISVSSSVRLGQVCTVLWGPCSRRRCFHASFSLHPPPPPSMAFCHGPGPSLWVELHGFQRQRVPTRKECRPARSYYYHLVLIFFSPFLRLFTPRGDETHSAILSFLARPRLHHSQIGGRFLLSPLFPRFQFRVAGAPTVRWTPSSRALSARRQLTHPFWFSIPFFPPFSVLDLISSLRSTRFSDRR